MNTTGHPADTPTIHVHTWRRVPAHVYVIGDPLFADRSSYNAACECGATEWVHWAPIKEEE